MRDIKFRAWLDEDERMLKPTSIWDFGGDYAGASIDGIYLTYQGYPDGKIPLMQYTGLKDKAGVEIYEGDIVLQDGEEIIVSYGIQEVDAFEGMGWNLWSFYDDDGNGYKANGVRLKSEIEVIGNLYENPELIKEEQL